ncbi:MAG: hypothetical protein ACE5M4_12225, partial [Anaerolineales bacterium]
AHSSFTRGDIPTPSTLPAPPHFAAPCRFFAFRRIRQPPDGPFPKTFHPIGRDTETTGQLHEPALVAGSGQIQESPKLVGIGEGRPDLQRGLHGIKDGPSNGRSVLRRGDGSCERLGEIFRSKLTGPVKGETVPVG